MTNEEWAIICSEVVDLMNDYVRPLVVPLSQETEQGVRLIGTGTFVQRESGGAIVTCEHVARNAPLNFRPYGHERVYSYTGAWQSFVEPIDVSWTTGALAKPVRAVPPHQVALQHQLSRYEELLFFYGYSGENSHYGFDVHETNGSGYLTQQKQDAKPDPSVIELLWPNGRHDWSKRTTAEARRQMKLDNPAGFSGSLVWNTRFLETGGDLSRWTPEQAVVTALLKRFVREDDALLALPIEGFRSVGGLE